MSWALLTISAAFIFAITSIIDKFLLTKWIKNPIVLVLILSGVGLLFGLNIYLFYGFSFLSGFNIALALIAGVIYFFGEIFYYKAVKLEEISKVVPLVFLSPLFVLLLATILSIFFPSFIKEEVNKSLLFQKIFAIILIFIGTLLII